ncbi:ribokinase [Halobacillus rhizosphaerae]|uniref:ribokinase n=1 Tax=Halobacillus rhizosphaerae TaxID=3064889 RepID=UPI00398B44E4
MKNPTVSVVGSINMDLTVSTDVIPDQGETVLGNQFDTFPGGKGANQAVAAARLGANVHFFGAVGDDVFGSSLTKHLRDEGIHTDGIETFRNKGTGTATIILSEQDNRIIVARGANAEVTPEFAERFRSTILKSDLILLQLEIPVETVSYIVNLASQHQIPVILNPAPYQHLTKEIIEQVAYLTPNEAEWRQLAKLPATEAALDKMIITKGRYGAIYYENREKRRVSGYLVDVQDTTGAGDTFNGALAAQLAAGQSIQDAIEFANAAAALSITKLGAQNGMPDHAAVQRFMQNK